MTKAFSYLRVSGRGQIAGDGFPRQRAAIKAYAAQHDLRIVQEFKDGGVSGTIENISRPGWQELMTALHSNGVRVIVIEKLDRLARDLMIQESAISDLRKHGFILLSTCEPDLCSNDPQRVFIRQILGAAAQLDKSQIVVKLAAARMRKRASTGSCEGRKPYGHYKGEQEIIERVRALHGAGVKMQPIADRLNSEGVPTRTEGKRWHGMQIKRILEGKN